MFKKKKNTPKQTTESLNAFYLLSISELMFVPIMCHNSLWSCTLLLGTLVLLLHAEFSVRLQTYSKTSFSSLSQRYSNWLSHNCVFERHKPRQKHRQKEKADGTLTTTPKKVCNCLWDYYINEAVLELSSISWSIWISENCMFWTKPRNKSRWKCSDSISPIFQNLQFGRGVTIVSESEYQREGARICVQSNLPSILTVL